MKPTQAPVSRQPVIQHQEKETYFLPASPFNHLARPAINHTCLEPTTQSAVKNTPEASPQCDGNDPENFLLPSPATSTLKPRYVAEDLRWIRRTGRAERYEGHRCQSNDGGTSKACECPCQRDTSVGAWRYLAQIPRCEESGFAFGEDAQFGGECIRCYGSVVTFSARVRNRGRSRRTIRGRTSLFRPPARRYRKTNTLRWIQHAFLSSAAADSEAVSKAKPPPSSPGPEHVF